MLSYKILITSPERISKEKLSARTAPTTGFEKLKKPGFELIKFPTIKIIQSKNCKSLDVAIKKIDVYNYLIFTSKNSVNFFMRKFFAAGNTKKNLRNVKVCAIGRKTAEEIKKWKIKVDLVPDKFNAEGLVKKIIKEVIKGLRVRGFERQKDGVFKGLRFLLPRGEKTKEILPAKIRKLGGKIDSPVLYRTVKPEVDKKQIKKILDQKFSAVAFTSPSAFDNFTEMLGEKADEFLRNTLIAVIGSVTAKAVKKAGFSVSIMPQTATIESMSNEIIKYYKKNKK